jgi:hypothetical protein
MNCTLHECSKEIPEGTPYFENAFGSWTFPYCDALCKERELRLVRSEMRAATRAAKLVANGMETAE